MSKVLSINHWINWLCPPGLHSVVLLTKSDDMCPHSAKDVGNMFYSEMLQKIANSISGKMGIQIHDVLPVASYKIHQCLNDNKSIQGIEHRMSLGIMRSTSMFVNWIVFCNEIEGWGFEIVFQTLTNQINMHYTVHSSTVLHCFYSV